jgi:hypothetical protein
VPNDYTQHGEKQFRHRIGIGTGCIENTDSLLCGFVHGNVIDPGSGAGHREQGWIVICIDPAAAHYYTMRIFHIGADLKAGPEKVQSFPGNTIDGFYPEYFFHVIGIPGLTPIVKGKHQKKASRLSPGNFRNICVFEMIMN